MNRWSGTRTKSTWQSTRPRTWEWKSISREVRARLGIYAALRVPEVWRFDGDQLIIHQLQADGQYIEVERSRYFPFLSGDEVVRFLQQRTQMDENALIRSF